MKTSMSKPSKDVSAEPDEEVSRPPPLELRRSCRWKWKALKSALRREAKIVRLQWENSPTEPQTISPIDLQEHLHRRIIQQQRLGDRTPLKVMRKGR